MEELFTSCAEATFEVMTDLSKVDSKEPYPLEIQTESLEELLYLFLSELIYLKDTENVLFAEFDLVIETGKAFKLSGKVRGETIKPEKHILRTDVKAVTYYQFQVKETEDGYYARVVLDL